MPRFTELKVWQAAQALTLEVYRLTKAFPKDEDFVLVPRLRRAVLSVGANVAEGQRRRTKRDSRHFIAIAEVGLWQRFSTTC